MPFKLTHDDAKFFHAQGSKGPFRIAKKGLGKAQHDKYLAMCNGGVVPQKLARGGEAVKAALEGKGASADRDRAAMKAVGEFVEPFVGPENPPVHALVQGAKKVGETFVGPENPPVHALVQGAKKVGEFVNRADPHGLMQQASGFAGVLTPTLTPMGGPARFLRGSVKSEGAARPVPNTARAVAEALAKEHGGWDAPVMVKEHGTGKLIPYDQDAGMTIRQAFEHPTRRLDPTVSPAQQDLRYPNARTTASGEAVEGGVAGNLKMREVNETYPHGRNTPDYLGCGRGQFCDANGIPAMACYGGKCYAFQEATTLHNRGDVLRNSAQQPLNKADSLRVKLQKAFREGTSVEDLRKQHPDLIITELGDEFKAKGRPLSIMRETQGATEGTGAYVSDTIKAKGGKQDVGWRDLRFGVDSDGGAWLSRPETILGVDQSGSRINSVYTSGYHNPPPSVKELREAGRADLADAMERVQGRTQINVTVSGQHPLADTFNRLRYAEEMREKGWNVVLREVTADPTTFAGSPLASLAEQRASGVGGKVAAAARKVEGLPAEFAPGYEKASTYNRLHNALQNDTDFYMMEQALHEGHKVGSPITGLPACCSGGNCSKCSTAEGLGRGALKTWGLDKDAAKYNEKILPGVIDYHGNDPLTPARGQWRMQSPPRPLDASIPWDDVRPVNINNLPAGTGPSLMDRTRHFVPEKHAHGGIAGSKSGCGCGGKCGGDCKCGGKHSEGGLIKMKGADGREFMAAQGALSPETVQRFAGGAVDVQPPVPGVNFTPADGSMSVGEPYPVAPMPAEPPPLSPEEQRVAILAMNPQPAQEPEYVSAENYPGVAATEGQTPVGLGTMGRTVLNTMLPSNLGDKVFGPEGGTPPPAAPAQPQAPYNGPGAPGWQPYGPVRTSPVAALPQAPVFRAWGTGAPAEIAAGFKGYEAAAQEKAKIEQNALSELSAFQQRTAAGLEQFSMMREQRYQERQQIADQLEDDVRNARVNPFQFYQQADTGAKVLAGVGMLLSGLGSGLTGQPNLAMDVINRAIDRDIEAQKFNIGKKQNYLSYYVKKTGDELIATNYLKADLLDAASATIEAKKIGMQAATAGPLATMTSQQMRMQAAELRQRAALQEQQGAMNHYNFQMQQRRLEMMNQMLGAQPGGALQGDHTPWIKQATVLGVVPRNETAKEMRHVPVIGANGQPVIDQTTGQPTYRTSERYYWYPDPERAREADTSFRVAETLIPSTERAMAILKKYPTGTAWLQHPEDHQRLMMEQAHISVAYEAFMNGMKRQPNKEVMEAVQKAMATDGGVSSAVLGKGIAAMETMRMQLESALTSHRNGAYY